MAVQGDPEANGANGRRRATPLVDPIAGMRAMAEIQADGLRAASELLERMLGSERDAPTTRTRAPAAEYSALVDAWAQLLQRFTAGLARPAESGPVTLAVDSTAAGPLVRLALERRDRGAGANAEIWIHNGTSSSVGPLALRCGALTAPGGDALDARVDFDPPKVQELAPRSSRGFVISVALDSEARAGIYRGTIQVDGAPMLWMPLEVAVEQC